MQRICSAQEGCGFDARPWLAQFIMLGLVHRCLESAPMLGLGLDVSILNQNCVIARDVKSCIYCCYVRYMLLIVRVWGNALALNRHNSLSCTVRWLPDKGRILIYIYALCSLTDRLTDKLSIEQMRINHKNLLKKYTWWHLAVSLLSPFPLSPFSPLPLFSVSPASLHPSSLSPTSIIPFYSSINTYICDYNYSTESSNFKLF